MQAGKVLLRGGELHTSLYVWGSRAAKGRGRGSWVVGTSSPGSFLLPHRKPFWRFSVETVRELT